VNFGDNKELRFEIKDKSIVWDDDPRMRLYVLKSCLHKVPIKFQYTFM